ncbi:hypothetical protein vBEco4M7_24 [Escherichia phage vB_Eco4M-7]|nr:hypothetical protein vBEco4M7_24 [Escherichia phage vB_Eco4M-7]
MWWSITHQKTASYFKVKASSAKVKPRKQRVSTGRKFIQNFFSQMGIIGATVSGDPAQFVSIDESNRHN